MSARQLATIALIPVLVTCAPVTEDTHTDGVVEADAHEPCDTGWGDLVWEEPVTGTCWHADAHPDPLTWEEARAWCEDSELGGHRDWRLPTIDELRSLVRGCAESEWGGSCKVTEGSGTGDWTVSDCVGCPYRQGQGAGESYWDPALGGPTRRGYWSASEVADRLGESWCVVSHDAFVSWEPQSSDDHHVRCVRGGPH